MRIHPGRFITLLSYAFVVAVLPPAARADRALTDRNKAVVRDFYTTVLINRDVDAAPRFLRADYIQHNPQVPTGLKGFHGYFSGTLRAKTSE